ncbi:mitochondrial ubiquitin ligase activator of NFKB 1 [Polypterus senegalus]|uniref:mitochondrial ubiquitin ligase activator of NFKB 1 n=1 Tax=Polypterus senegalus TaxID=55291 RepID=UPI0019629A20|nr:mitochondrial ubiquitin ligase activator of NFKB 1 [Polypterus senegalus]XP_039611772.1 mitochondrial ubiquitin ligase activator of NFKB 1 [Polypterus senegalus]XP_039611773.1 mitochondrial ubiquitin ligase activator of NFKB 1 [Polypterus senegalus]
MENNGRPSAPQIILLASSSALTTILYMVYRRRSEVVRKLKEAAKLSITDELKDVLTEAPGKCVPYAVVEGVVKAVQETLDSQFVKNCKGVIQRLTLKEHKMVWNRTTHLWNDCEKIIVQPTNTVPFDLASHDDSIRTSVRVVRPLDVSELDLETIYEKFHPTVQSFSDVIGHFISGERPKGIRETEEMLKVGTAITGVGEVVLENSLIKLQPPKQGMHYFISQLDYEGLLQKQQSKVRTWKILTVAFGVATCIIFFLILKKQYRRYREQKRLRALQDELREQQRKSAAWTEESISPNTCVICLSRDRCFVFLECGHVCSCDECYRALPMPKTCPICRKNILRVVPLYNS